MTFETRSSHTCCFIIWITHKDSKFALEDLEDTGCYGNPLQKGEESYPGKGKPVDLIDELSKSLLFCYKCAAKDHGGECKGRGNYNSSFNKRTGAKCLDRKDTCEYTICQCDLQFAKVFGKVNIRLKTRKNTQFRCQFRSMNPTAWKTDSSEKNDASQKNRKMPESIADWKILETKLKRVLLLKQNAADLVLVELFLRLWNFYCLCLTIFWRLINKFAAMAIPSSRLDRVNIFILILFEVSYWYYLKF